MVFLFKLCSGWLIVIVVMYWSGLGFNVFVVGEDCVVIVIVGIVVIF